MQRYETGENVSYDGKESVKILVTGASGFIGSRVVSKLLSLALSLSSNKNYEILCLSRNRDSLKDRYWKHEDVLKIVEADVNNYPQLVKAMNGVNVAFYLIHSMEGLSKEWKEFAQKDRTAAENFAKAATECGVERIIYLGGLIHGESREDYNKLSEHMRSRKEVGDILRTSSARVTIFRAAVILGQGGGSFQMLEYLVKRLPAMVCPRWVLTRSQPISVDDVVEYLVKSINVKETEARYFDIGGTEVLTYLQMMKRYAKMLNKSIKIVIIPFLTPRLSSYWVDLITPVKASLARPLIDSLKHEAIVHDDKIQILIPIRLKNFEESIRTAMKEEVRKAKVTKKQKTSDSLNKTILFFSLISLAIIGTTYYFLDNRSDIFSPLWITLAIVWYFGILFAIYFVKNGARLGSMVAGIIGWITLAFWLFNNIYLISDNTINFSSHNTVITIRNFIGAIVAGLSIAASHNLFHKIRMLGK